jgi:hypothetical protein
MMQRLLEQVKSWFLLEEDGKKACQLLLLLKVK